MMKLTILAGLVVMAVADVGNFLNKPQKYYKSIQSKPVIKKTPPYAILHSDKNLHPDGTYQYSYETENGISAHETGELKAIGDSAGTAVVGSYHYTSPEGIFVEIRYLADENGFQPIGNVLPLPGQPKLPNLSGVNNLKNEPRRFKDKYSN